MGREREVGETAGDRVQMTAAQKELGCSSTTSNAVSRPETGNVPTKNN